MSLKKLEAALKNAPNKLVKNRIKKAINIYTELGDKRLAKDMLGPVIEKSIFGKKGGGSLKQPKKKKKDKRVQTASINPIQDPSFATDLLRKFRDFGTRSLYDLTTRPEWLSLQEALMMSEGGRVKKKKWYIPKIFKDYSWDEEADKKQIKKILKLSPKKKPTTKKRNGGKIKKPRGWGAARYNK
jgi:hypothetical protein